MMWKSSVIVPTYKRLEYLRRCLESLQKQICILPTHIHDIKPTSIHNAKLTNIDDTKSHAIQETQKAVDETYFSQNIHLEIIVVVRQTDIDTQKFVYELQKSCDILRVVLVDFPGQVFALNAGLKACQGDIISFIDDDAIPHPDWLARIQQSFLENHKLGAIGGRDYLHQNGYILSGTYCHIGKIAWYGKIFGNHHLGTGKPIRVDHLKGVNMSFRRVSLANLNFDERLWGTGAQFRNDFAICLAVRRAGWEIWYDPEIAVDHFSAPRLHNDPRQDFDENAIIAASHNEMFVVLTYLYFWEKIPVILYGIFVGTIFIPGPIQWLRLFITGKPYATSRWRASWKGRWQGLRTFFKKRV